MLRNTSSSRPSSVCNSSTCQPLAAARTFAGQFAVVLVDFGINARPDPPVFLLDDRVRRALGTPESRSANLRAGASADDDQDRAGQIGFLLQLLRRAVGDNLAAVNDDGPRTNRLDFLQNVRRKNNGLAFAHPADQAADLVLLVRVQAVGRFVQHQHVGIVDDGLGETGAMAVTLGKRVHALIKNAIRESTFRRRDERPSFLASPRKPRNSAQKLKKALHRHVRVSRGVFRQIADEPFGGNGICPPC